MSTRAFAVIGFATALAGAAFAGEAPTSPAPDQISAKVKVGDVWEYKLQSNLEGRASAVESFVVQDVSAGKIEGELRTHRTSGGGDKMQIVVFDPYWRIVEGPKGQREQADPKEEPFPAVSVGQEWTSVSYWRPRYSSLRFRWTEHGRVEAWESVKLASGQIYDAFRIVRRRESATGDGSGITLVQAGETTHKMVERDVEWYAPAVNRFVKRTFEASSDGTVATSFSEELTAYKPGQ